MPKNSDCLKCKLSNGSGTVCIWGRSYGDNPKLMVVTDFATPVEDKYNVLDGSGKDRLLVQIVDKVMSRDVGNIYRTNLIKCRPNGNDPSTKDMDKCFDYLLEEIITVKPECILVLGKLASNYLLGDNSKVDMIRGTLIDMTYRFGDEKWDTKLITTYSPAFVDSSKNDTILKNFAKDISLAYDVSMGDIEAESTSNTKLCKTGDDVVELIKYIKDAGEVYFDIETAGTKDVSALTWHSDKVICTVISFSFQHGSSYVVPIDHFETPFSNEERDAILHALKVHVFENPEIRKGAHNLKFDALNMLHKFGISMRGRIDDSMLMHHIWDETKRHGLKEIVSDYWRMFDGYEKKVKMYRWEEVPLDILADYSGADTDLGFRVMTLMEAKLTEDERLYRLYRNLTMFAFKALLDAELNGMDIEKDRLDKYIKISKKYIDKQEEKLRNYREVKRFERSENERIKRETLEELEEKLRKARLRIKTKDSVTIRNYEEKIRNVKSGVESVYNGINFGSHIQLGALLYTQDGFGYDEPYDKKKRKNSRTTNKDIISQFDDYSGFIEDLFFWRSLSKTVSTYLVGIQSRLDRDGRVHSSFLLHGTESGRLSSRDPNLQNLPNKGKLKNPVAKEVVGFVKDCFIAPEGYKIVQVDYSQAELRIAAEFAGETTMLKAYEEGQDLHSLTASTMMGISLEEFLSLPKDERGLKRFMAKAVNFGLIYGMSAEGLQEYARTSYGIPMTLQEAKQARKNYFKLYPRLKHFHSLYVQKAVKYGYVRTLFGRKRQCPDIYDDDDYIRSFSERIAVNSPVQGTAGEFTILAFAFLRNRLDPRVKFVNTIHDSVLYYIPNDILDDSLRMIKYTCENLITEPFFGKKLEKVGMKVDIELSDQSWRDMEEYELPTK